MRKLFFVLLLMAPSLAVAEPYEDIAFDLRLYQPDADGAGILMIESPRTLALKQPSFGLVFHHAVAPLKFGYGNPDEPTQAQNVFGGRAILDLMGGIGFGPADVILQVPIILAQPSPGSDDGPTEWGLSSITGGGIGDIRLTPKVRIIDSTKKRFGFGFAAPLSFPTGKRLKFQGTGSVRWNPMILGEFKDQQIQVDANIGVDLHKMVRNPYLKVNNEFTWGLGVAGSPLKNEKLWILGAIHGRAGGPYFNQNPAEWLLGARVIIRDRLQVEGSLGTGLGRGYGTPTFTWNLGVRYVRWKKMDEDGDGVADAKDMCPAEMEDMDGHLDEDGCFDSDNDADGVPDADDPCPNDAENVNGVDDEDGCPEDVPDQDGDGIADEADKCPDLAETANGIDDDDGCPDEPIMLRGGGLVVVHPVPFEGNVIIDPGNTILDSLATILAEHAEITKVRVKATALGDSIPEALMASQARADLVLEVLIQKGVAADRLEAIGQGRPLENELDGVTFVVLDAWGQEVAAPPEEDLPSDAPEDLPTEQLAPEGEGDANPCAPADGEANPCAPAEGDANPCAPTDEAGAEGDTTP